MIGNYKVKVFIFAGRRKFMELCVKQMLQHEQIDGITICMNQRNDDDREYAKSLPSLSDKITLMYCPDEITSVSERYYYFFGKHRDIDTIYFKVDDDVVYISPNAIKTLLEYRLSHIEYVSLFPFVVNNPMCNCMVNGRWMKNGVSDMNYMEESWKSGEFAKNLHLSFIKYGLHGVSDTDFTYTSCYYVKSRKDWIRPAINFLCYFGFEMNAMYTANSECFKHDADEQFIVHDYMMTTTRMNHVCTDAVVAHFSFGPQSEYLKHYEDEILAKYKEKANKDYGIRIF